MHNEDELPPHLIPLPRMRKIVVIDVGQGLLLVNLEEEHHRERICKGPTHRGLENDAMSKALNQISKSLFTHRIERATFPWRLHQPTFTIYNRQMDPVEHVSHFSQRTAVYSKDETLMCKVFPSSLRLVATR